MSKIYIIGSVGSGKSTLARKMTLSLNIPNYELDDIIWQKNEAGPDTKRNKKEIDQLFNNIIAQDNWIIEDVGRNCFNKGFASCDLIIYLNIKRELLYWRVIKRWLKQNIGLENSPYNHDLKMLMQMFKWINKEKNDSKLNILLPFINKTIILNEKSIKQYIKPEDFKKLVLKK